MTMIRKQVEQFMIVLLLLLLQQNCQLVDSLLVHHHKQQNRRGFTNKYSLRITKLSTPKHNQLFAHENIQRQTNDLCGHDISINTIEHQQSVSSLTSRRTMLQCIVAASTTFSSLVGNVNAEDSTTSKPLDDDASLTVIKTSSGLKYIDLIPGTGMSPQYGNLCSVQYNAYIKLAKTPDNPNPQPQLYDKVTDGYLIKHGNGRMIPGLDEGLHTMKVGGYRRLLIPPKLGYIDSGLGPIPEYPWQRYRLNSLLDQMIKIGAGTIIFEIKLVSIIDDEADQGYYLDDSLSPEDFNTLRENLRIKGLQERQKQQIS